MATGRRAPRTVVRLSKQFSVLLGLVLLACGAPYDPSTGIVYDPCEPVVILPGEGTSAQQLEGIRTAIGLWREVGITALTLDAAGDATRAAAFQGRPDLFHGVYEARKWARWAST